MNGRHLGPWPRAQDSAYRPAPEHWRSIKSRGVTLTKRKVAFGIAGLVIGFLVAFTWTRGINNSAMVSESQPQPGAAGPNAQAGSAGQQAGMASVRDVIERARNNPADFEAQV